MTLPNMTPFWRWEEALTRHYLRSDGGFGSAPLSFLDVSGVELARAVGKGPSEAAEALEGFLKIFERKALIDALTHGQSLPPPIGLRVPGFFSYLVLSCHVASVAPEVASSGDYRDRLQDILKMGQGIRSLTGLRLLWEKLPRWIESKRSTGQGYRNVVLPDYGTMKQIGYSIRIAFPSRHDLGKMNRLFGHFGDLPSPSASELISIVVPELGLNWSAGFLHAFNDFHARRQLGERLLADHPFWVGVLGLRQAAPGPGVDATFEIDLTTDSDGQHAYSVRTDIGRVIQRLTGQVQLSSDQDVVSIAAARDEILDLLASPPPSVPPSLARSFADGVLPFSEIEWGLWRAERVPTGANVRLLVRDDHLRKHDLPRAGKDGWCLLDGVTHAQALGVIHRLTGRRPDPAPELARVRVAGGIRMDKAYLGRPGFLPVIEAAEGCAATPTAFDGSHGSVTASIDGRLVRLAADGPIEGVWRIAVAEGGVVQAEPNLVFEPHAREFPFIEPDELADGWRPDEPSLTACTPSAVDLVDPHWAGGVTDAAFMDLLEAVFAKGRRGWSEQDIVGLIAPRLPTPYAVWDVLQLLADSGWMEPRVSRHWRARRWFLRPPRLLAYPKGDALLLDGAVPELTRRRFERTAKEMGGTVEWRRSAAGWAIPSGNVKGTQPEAFAAAMQMDLRRAQVEVPLQGSAIQFRPTLYSENHRIVASSWNWSSGRFAKGDRADAGAVRLERLTTLKPNAADVYRVTTGNDVKHLLDGRSAAILMAHRLAGKPAFRFIGDQGLVERLSLAGALPVQITRYLMLRNGCGPALDFANLGARRYVTGCRPEDATILSGWLGATFEMPKWTSDNRQDILRSLVLGRARGTARSRNMAIQRDEVERC
ncbi:hypothetical protein [Bosea sp. 685]|uniref:hypothetical protein n=1 Tax=Bosea sp. 685 TaxID=3080057 RepID=UPI0028937AC6|nr:hypothetical protein [Bosea sp. 685]WNJ89601.1 hypothetical protein RMR04_24840 [Bosea sp. 685]